MAAAEVTAPVQTVPANGAVGVAPNAPIRITFDRPVDPSTANVEHLRLVPIDETYVAQRVLLSLDAARRVLTVTPSAALKGRYRVEIRGVRTDRATVNHNFSFTAQHNSITKIEVLFDGEPSFTRTNALDSQGRVRRELMQWAGEPVSSRNDLGYDPRGALPATSTWFAAGNDGVFNTADDVPENVTVRLFDDLGFPTRATTFAVGADGRLGTSDDSIIQYDSFLRVGDTTWVTFWVTGPGKDGVWFNADDDADRVERFDLDAAGRFALQTRYVAPGPDGLWRTADDVADLTSTATYGATGVTGITTDAGDDGKLGTADDDQNRTFSAINAAGFETSWTYFTDKGADRRWGTADDVISDVYRYEPAQPFPRLEKLVGGPGADGRWGTSDDELFRFDRNEYASSGAQRQSLTFDDAGPDGVWFTADDVLESRIVYNTTL